MESSGRSGKNLPLTAKYKRWQGSSNPEWNARLISPACVLYNVGRSFFTMDNLRTQLEKLPLPGFDPSWYYELLTAYPEGEWFYPTNKENESYQACRLLSDMNLIEKRNEPIWVNNSFRGQRYFFRYKKDLIYGGN